MLQITALISTVVGYAAQLEGQVPSQNQFLFAMEELIRKYPLLRTAIIDTDNIPSKGPSYLFWMNKIDLRSAVRVQSRTDSNTWIQIFRTELHLPFTKDFDALDKKVVDQTGIPAYFKFVLVAPESTLGPFEIVFGIHHAIADGMAGICVFRDFLEILGKATQSNASPAGLDSKLDPTVLKSQSLEQVLDIRPSIWNLLHVVLTEEFPFLRPKRKDWRGPPQLESFNRTSDIVVVQIPKAQTDALLQHCKSHNSTVTAALFTASHFAVAKLLKHFPVVSSNTACNLRPFCEPKLPPNTMGTFVCGPEAVYNLEGHTQFWEFARQSKKHHTSTIQEYYQQIGMLGFLTSIHKFFEKRKRSEPNARNCTLSLSNLGSIPFPENFQSFSLRGCYFSNVKFGEGPVFMESVVTVQGTLHLTISNVEQITTRADTETFVKYVLEALTRCEQNKTFTLQEFTVI